MVIKLKSAQSKQGYLSFEQQVYVARNPKDAIVSFYHHTKLVKQHNFQGTLEEFAEYFMEDESKYASDGIPFLFYRLGK